MKKRIKVEAHAVLSPGWNQAITRRAWQIEGVGVTTPPSAWRDAALGQQQNIDGMELARRNPDWKTVPCTITVEFEAPDLPSLR